MGSYTLANTRTFKIHGNSTNGGHAISMNWKQESRVCPSPKMLQWWFLHARYTFDGRLRLSQIQRRPFSKGTKTLYYRLPGQMSREFMQKVPWKCRKTKIKQEFRILFNLKKSAVFFTFFLQIPLSYFVISNYSSHIFTHKQNYPSSIAWRIVLVGILKFDIWIENNN